MLDRAGRGGLLAAAFASHGACCPGSLPACRAERVRQGPDGLLLGAWLAALAGPAWLERWLEDRIAVPPPSGGVLGADRAPVPMFEAAATPARVGAPARHLGWKRWLAALARALAEGTALRRRAGRGEGRSQRFGRKTACFWGRYATFCAGSLLAALPAPLARGAGSGAGRAGRQACSLLFPSRGAGSRAGLPSLLPGWLARGGAGRQAGSQPALLLAR